MRQLTTNSALYYRETDSCLLDLRYAIDNCSSPGVSDTKYRLLWTSRALDSSVILEINELMGEDLWKN